MERLQHRRRRAPAEEERRHRRGDQRGHHRCRHPPRPRLGRRPAGIGHRVRRERAGQPVELEDEVPRRLHPPLRRLLQAVPDDRVEPRDALARIRQLFRLVAGDRGHHLDRRLAEERPGSRQHLEQHQAEREEVRAVVERQVAGLFRRDVLRRTHYHPGRGEAAALAEQLGAGFRLEQLGDVEVEDLHPPFAGDEDVVGLEIAVEDALLVRRREAAGDLDRVVDRLARLDRAGVHLGAQRSPDEELGHQVARLVLLAEVVDGDEVRMVQPAGGAGLELESLQLLGPALDHAGVEHLDGDVAAHAGVARAPHDAGCAAAQQRAHLVGSESLRHRQTAGVRCLGSRRWCRYPSRGRRWAEARSPESRRRTRCPDLAERPRSGRSTRSGRSRHWSR